MHGPMMGPRCTQVAEVGAEATVGEVAEAEAMAQQAVAGAQGAPHSLTGTQVASAGNQAPAGNVASLGIYEKTAHTIRQTSSQATVHSRATQRLTRIITVILPLTSTTQSRRS